MTSIYAFTAINVMMCIGMAFAYLHISRLAKQIQRDLAEFGGKINALEG